MQQLAAAKVSRLAHDGSQPMAPPLSSGAPCVRASACVCVCVCEGERERGEDRERGGGGTLKERDRICTLVWISVETLERE